MARENPAKNLVVRGDYSWYVRQSKVAMRRYLKKKARKRGEHSSLRRALAESLRTRPSRADAAWEHALKRVEKLEGRTVDGELGVRIDEALAPFWPRDNMGRRILRRTPAWKKIPGQVSRNFNIREFDCNDGTGYIEGLMREQHLTKAQAWERARKNARYLERVREREGQPIRLFSVYRTIPYNARIGGASNSAHIRGKANDCGAGRLSLQQHRAVMRAVFPAGVGYYPAGAFVHGDWDMSLGRRDWTGP